MKKQTNKKQQRDTQRDTYFQIMISVTVRNSRKSLWERGICCGMGRWELGWVACRWVNTREWPECSWEPVRRVWPGGSQRESDKMRQAKAGRAPVRWCIILLSMWRMWDIILSAKGSYWIVLSRGTNRCNFLFWKNRSGFFFLWEHVLERWVKGQLESPWVSLGERVLTWSL